MEIIKNPEEFFKNSIDDALRDSNVSMSDYTEFYLVSLLSGFVDSNITNEPLGIQLFKVREPAKRIVMLKDVGDTSLFVSGFLDKDVNYYSDVGGAAYYELSIKMDKSILAEIYYDLARRFKQFIELLSRVRARCK